MNVRDELSFALERDELVLHYQAITNLEDGQIIGAEALLRWDHPERGLLLPGEFLERYRDDCLLGADPQGPRRRIGKPTRELD